MVEGGCELSYWLKIPKETRALENFQDIPITFECSRCSLLEECKIPLGFDVGLINTRSQSKDSIEIYTNLAEIELDDPESLVSMGVRKQRTKIILSSCQKLKNTS